MIRCFEADVRSHFAKVGEYLRECRVRRDKRLVDMRVRCQNCNDFMHSSVGAAHSQVISKVIDSQNPPYDLDMTGFPPQVVVKVIDWMYYGEIDIVVREIGEYLAVTGALGIDKLHEQLEVRLQQCAIRADLRVPCINIAAEPRFRVSEITLRRLVSLMAGQNDALTSMELKQLTPAAIIALVADANVPFVQKVNLLNIAVQWLKLPPHAQFMDNVLSSVRVPNLNTTELNCVINEIAKRFMHPDCRYRETLYVFSDDGKRIIVGSSPEKYGQGALFQQTPSALNEDASTEAIEEMTAKQQTCTTTEMKQTSKHLKRTKKPAPQQPSRFELSPMKEVTPQQGQQGQWGLSQDNVYRPTQKGSQELINARAFSSEEKAENEALPDLIGSTAEKHYLGTKNKAMERGSSTGQSQADNQGPEPSSNNSSLRPQSTQSVSETPHSSRQGSGQPCETSGPYYAKPMGPTQLLTPYMGPLGAQAFNQNQVGSLPSLTHGFRQGGYLYGPQQGHPNSSFRMQQPVRPQMGPQIFSRTQPQLPASMQQCLSQTNQVGHNDQMPVHDQRLLPLQAHPHIPSQAQPQPIGNLPSQVLPGAMVPLAVRNQIYPQMLPQNYFKMPCPQSPFMQNPMQAETRAQVHQVQPFGPTAQSIPFPDSTDRVQNLMSPPMQQQVRSVRPSENVLPQVSPQMTPSQHPQMLMEPAVRTTMRAPSQETVNRNAFGTESIAEMGMLPNCFSSKGGPSYSSISNQRRRMSSILDIRVLPEHRIESAGSHSQYTVGLPGMDTFRQIDSLPNISYRSGSSQGLNSSTRRSDITVNRNEFGPESTAEMRNLPNYFDHPGQQHDGLCRSRSDETINRHAFGEESIADINALPNFFDNNGNVRSDQRHGLRGGDVSNPCVEISSDTDLTYEQKRLRYTPSEIMEINAHPHFLPSDYVIGKKHLTREELEELREIPPITGHNSKLPIINRYEFPPDEVEDIKNLPNITNSQFTVGRRLRSEEELRDLAQLPNLEDKTPPHLRKQLSPASAANVPTNDASFMKPTSEYVYNLHQKGSNQ
uniref:BTB domain-containing protein n=1 Tax=Parascaris univalens TaxID=6257 RepID=A0A915AXW5_PARUN